MLAQPRAQAQHWVPILESSLGACRVAGYAPSLAAAKALHASGVMGDDTPGKHSCCQPYQHMLEEAVANEPHAERHSAVQSVLSHAAALMRSAACVCKRVRSGQRVTAFTMPMHAIVMSAQLIKLLLLGQNSHAHLVSTHPTHGHAACPACI